MKKSTATIYSQAIQYVISDGYSVIPVGKDKRPLLSSWKPYQSRKPDEDEIKEWFEKWPDANVGIVTGKISNLTVVDVDTHKGGNPAPFPKTFTVKTGNGGLQMYYQYQEGLSVSANAYDQFPHVDIRSDGGYVVAPPSVITPTSIEGKKRKGAYDIEDDEDIAEFPSALFSVKKKRSISSLVGIKTGARNDSLASIVGQLVYNRPQSKMADAFSAVVAINKTYAPPISENELATIFNSIVKKELERQSDVGEATLSPFQIESGERIQISLRKNGNNMPYKDATNALLAISQHPATKDKIKYNEFTQIVEYEKTPGCSSPWEEMDTFSLVHILQGEIKLAGIGKDIVYDAVRQYAYENRYDEAKQWLQALKWDKTPRLDTWLISATGVPDDKDGYHRGIGAHWFSALVRRLMYPGCIFDYVLVIVGPQGVGKTSLFRIIGGPWYKSFTGNVDNKDFYIKLQGAAVVDLDEGVAMYKSDSIKIKSIITETHDEYRAPYDRTTKKYPRRFVFSMSTNDTEPFRDVTGNRRYWTVDIEEKVDFKWLEENREQLFAEAYYRILHNDKLPDVPFDIAAERQQDHVLPDEWSEPIGEYLKSSEKYCTGDPLFTVTITEIYDRVLKETRIVQLERKHEMRIGNILRKDFGMMRARIMAGGEYKYRYVLTPKRSKELQEKPLSSTHSVEREWEENL